MSRLKERKEKICLNCRAEMHGRYCHQCGQENIEPYETAWHLIRHFFNDITHFDGKFFITLKYLVIKPGYLSKEYMLGRRATFLNPIRMYIFSSAIFFLLFFSINDLDPGKFESKLNGRPLSEINAMDSVSFAEFTKELNNGKPLTRDEFILFMDTTTFGSGIKFNNSNYKTKAAYDSALKSGLKDSWIVRELNYKIIQLNKNYQNDKSRIVTAFLNVLMHSLPQMLFISLPLFALILQLLYIRRKNYYYASHIIFSVHLYIFAFIQLLILISLSLLKNYMNWDWLQYPIIVGYAYFFFYEYKAMRNFYQQRRAKTIFKFIGLNFFHFILLTLLFVIFSFFSLFNM